MFLSHFFPSNSFGNFDVFFRRKAARRNSPAAHAFQESRIIKQVRNKQTASSIFMATGNQIVFFFHVLYIHHGAK